MFLYGFYIYAEKHIKTMEPLWKFQINEFKKLRNSEHVHASLTSTLTSTLNVRQLSSAQNRSFNCPMLSLLTSCHDGAEVGDSTEVTVQHMTCISTFI